MKKILITALLFAATSAYAQEPPHAPTPDEAANAVEPAPKQKAGPHLSRPAGADAPDPATKITLSLAELKALLDNASAPVAARLAECRAASAIQSVEDQVATARHKDP